MKIKKLLVLLIVNLIILSMGIPSFAQPSGWAKESVDRLKNENMVSNELLENGKFQNFITREEFCELAVRLYSKGAKVGVEGLKSENTFVDTDSEMVGKAFNLGIVSGVSQKLFKPQDFITREQMATMLYRELGILGIDRSYSKKANFDDMSSVSEYASDPVNYCVENKILNGIGAGMLSPKSNTTREAAMVIMDRVAQKYGWVGGQQNTAMLDVTVKAGEHYGKFYPQMAIWIEDLDGNFIKTVFATDKIANNDWFRDLRKNATPYWSGKKVDENLDAVSSATPSNDFKCSANVEKSFGEIVIAAEINNSFDYNSSYPGGGEDVNGQPSIVYKVKIDLNSNGGIYELTPVGHGSHTGEDGKLYNDISKLTTAKDIVESIKVEIK